jgi:hypothetical protein
MSVVDSTNNCSSSCRAVRQAAQDVHVSGIAPEKLGNSAKLSIGGAASGQNMELSACATLRHVAMVLSREVSFDVIPSASPCMLMNSSELISWCRAAVNMQDGRIWSGIPRLSSLLHGRVPAPWESRSLPQSSGGTPKYP